MKQGVWMAIVLGVSASVWGLGIDPVPQEDGLGGSLTVGAAWLKVKSNSFAGSGYQTLTENENGSVFSSPDSESTVSPLFGASLSYTFADSRTCLFLDGVSLDRLQFDRVMALGLRRELADKSLLEASFLFTTSPAEVWTDPFVTGANRDETDRESTGGRIGWGRMFGTGLQLQYTYREIDIDHETSGQSLGLTAAERALLNREGDHHQAEAMYIIPLASNQWLAPTLRVDRYDLDGEAMAHDRYTAALTHVYAGADWKLITELSGGMADYDKQHPVFTKTRDDLLYGVSALLLYPKLLGRDDLVGTLGVGYWRQNSDISFYDEEMLAITAGTTWKF